MNTQTVVFDILVESYGRMYGNDLCEAMAEHIVSRIDNGTFLTHGDIMNYVWMNTTGGGVADATATKIQSALPQRIQNNHRRSYKGKVS